MSIDADGGFRGNSLGFCTASKILNSKISDILREFDIDHSRDKWINNKYSKYYYGIRVKRNKIDKFLKSFPFRNKEKLDRIYQRFQ